MDCQPSDTDRGEPTYTEPPRRDDSDKSLPKNFDKPLTCFFWYQTGRCSKRDIDCIYAHYDTGYYAAGPIHVARPTGTIAVAGRNARQMSSTNAPLQILPSIADLHLKAARLAAWEQELMRREASVGREIGESSGRSIADVTKALHKGCLYYAFKHDPLYT
ncbi:hypothetical protein HBI82_144390 [Parastagonospora nodorum]|nr:hypothetical protein HBH49_192910 [Parastagonospora nodorum]KAH4389261.1 hypothetical protein HBH99_163480 [Parastagonospora nodorum]KAH4421355.1 hypothetical protein HBH93_201790 [Parastagonospora nodorum]KAH4499923.1 hypothetical protein HBH89_121580 [Parastagonospora nodorum]KAH4528713.1 hypothetical protein HBH85_203340 [Parastagonospora nodorum]